MRNLRDTDGENLAVRWFLAGYCKGGVTAKEMRKHMEMSGYGGAWPKWASDFNGHLTKAGAQLWIRHLFNLEQPAQQEPVATFDEVWDAIDWDKWRMKPIRDLVEMIHRQTSSPAQSKPSRTDFENWLRSKWTAGYGCPKVDGRYTDDSAQAFWECWQAAHGIKEST